MRALRGFNQAEVEGCWSDGEERMSTRCTITDSVLDAVRAYPDCTLEELTQRLQELNWSEVFLEVDRLSRSGQLRLTQSGDGFLTKLQVR